jgi:O-antigen/teichoic acid export membrane protein
MWQLGQWEWIFISGYSLGLLYTLTKSGLWRNGFQARIKKETVTEYGQLSISSGLNNATTYCDKMLIYPLIGGHSVSVYNAAAVVSKMMSLVSVPLRNVFLSYIVDMENIAIPNKKHKKIKYMVFGLSVVIYGVFYGASVVCCRILYPQYYELALRYIPIILLAILFETYAGLLKVYLLRFENTKLQVITSSVKVFLYLISVLILNVVCKLGLIGFCASILIADFVHFMIALSYFMKNIKKQRGGQ